MMHSIAWWPSFGVLLVASGIDLFTRRIPNWLVVPFLISGIALQFVTGGWAGGGRSLAGIGVALLLFGPPCFLKGMGMGDLKLAVGVGAWIGPGQLFIAFVMTGIVGGVIAIGYALWHGRLGNCLDNTSDLLTHFAKSGARPHQDIRLGEAKAISIPYAPAIAIGTLFSFFAQ
jgi:prepilin peptidase CpaA